MIYRLRTLSYFTSWGLIYGLILGAFSGTAILPYFGTMYAVLWGTGIGLACGLLSGVVGTVIQTTSFNAETDLDSLRRRLSLGMGGLIGVASPFLLTATTNGLLWGSGMMRDMLPYTALSLFSAAFWGALSAAYTGSYYPEFMARVMVRRDYEADEETVNPIASRRDIFDFTRNLLSTGLNRWVLLLIGGGGGLIYTLSNIRLINPMSAIFYFIVGGIVAVIGAFFMSLYVAFGNASLLMMLKRLIFREYFPHLSPHWTRLSLTLISFVFTLAVTYWTFILAPVIAMLTAAVVYLTLTANEKTEKAKRKAKNDVILQHNLALNDDRGKMGEAETQPQDDLPSLSNLLK